MKKIIFFFVLMSCAGRNNDWDSGAQKSSNYQEEQRQEQIDQTNMQDTIPGRADAGQH